MAEEIRDNPTHGQDLPWLDRCPDCGYLLAGLPERGICPECGFAYDTEMIVLYGWAQGMRATNVNRRRGRFSWGLFWLVRGVFVLYLLVPVVFRRNLISAALPVVIVLLVATSLYRRRRLLADAPAPVQLRLMPEGFGQRGGIGKVKLSRWKRRSRVWILPLWRRNRYRIRSWRPLRLVLWRRRHVDFEFECGPETARQIGERIEQWHTAALARGPGHPPMVRAQDEPAADDLPQA